MTPDKQVQPEGEKHIMITVENQYTHGGVIHDWNENCDKIGCQIYVHKNASPAQPVEVTEEFYHDLHCNTSRNKPMGCEGCSCYLAQAARSSKYALELIQLMKVKHLTPKEQGWSDSDMIKFADECIWDSYGHPDGISLVKEFFKKWSEKQKSI